MNTILIKIGLIAVLISSCFSCVSSKIYDDLKSKYDALEAENESLMAQLDGRRTGNDLSISNCQEELEALKNEKIQLAMDYEAVKNSYDRLKATYDALEANSSELLTDNLQRNRDLLANLDEKEKALIAEQERLLRLQQELNAKARRVTELEDLIAAKEDQMNQLKAAISAALVDFEGQGLTVEQRDGKVYVSMENKLLFNSGSWAVNQNGKTAVVALARVLANNTEISVLIEGHTDNVPYTPNGNIKDNWDLSTKRATAIVAIIIANARIDENRLTAAGRGEFAPVASNDSAEGRAANRRIEVILAPKLDEISRLLNQIDD